MIQSIEKKGTDSSHIGFLNNSQGQPPHIKKCEGIISQYQKMYYCNKHLLQSKLPTFIVWNTLKWLFPDQSPKQTSLPSTWSLWESAAPPHCRSLCPGGGSLSLKSADRKEREQRVAHTRCLWTYWAPQHIMSTHLPLATVWEEATSNCMVRLGPAV